MKILLVSELQYVRGVIENEDAGKSDNTIMLD